MFYLLNSLLQQKRQKKTSQQIPQSAQSMVSTQNEPIQTPSPTLSRTETAESPSTLHPTTELSISQT